LEDISNEMNLPQMKPKKHPKNEPLFLKQLKTRNSEASCEDEKEEVFSNDIGKHSKQNVSIYFVQMIIIDTHHETCAVKPVSEQ
jgi:hypothetical protein